MSGKRWFYSLGQRSMHSDFTGVWPTANWPEWARLAFFRGQDAERWSTRIGTKDQ